MTDDDGALFPLPARQGSGVAVESYPFAAPARLQDVMHPQWASALAPAAGTVHALADYLEQQRREGREVLPAPTAVLRVFQQPLEAVKVLIVGQDPYPTPGHPIGLSFAVERHVRPLPRSLANIYAELHADLGIPPAGHGDLSAWSGQGVLLLNRVLSVEAGHAGAHRRKGWEQVTDLAVRALAARGGPLVAVLWGRDAQSLAPLLGAVPRVESAHPSPLSASRGFFGSRPFSRVNELLAAQGAAPVDWRLPADLGR
ncbi:Uracil-DNA glycosylase [Arthrobacter crystallopoietes BAB-32]|uniref:Uracil-DNA glycosylase n=1 Tax=Arthrobacter crystallopoietes BAB-32 TaxID=1246476 RepID=N1UX44_9MICC|nr:uracil-DNA glycosylase [Arthrobacter crystallopoietes]EMY32309.1 Uracil-DNA glycosylase [Arthrobacter crystallopoietes BAB-32]